MALKTTKPMIQALPFVKKLLGRGTPERGRFAFFHPGILLFENSGWVQHGLDTSWSKFRHLFLAKKGHPPLGRRMPLQCTKQNRGGGRLYRNSDPTAACGRITRRCNQRHPCHPAGCQQRQRRTCYRNRRCRRLPGKRRCRLLSGRWTRTGDPACWKRKP